MTRFSSTALTRFFLGALVVFLYNVLSIRSFFSNFPCLFSCMLSADGEEEVDVVSVEPQTRCSPCSPQDVSVQDETSGCLSVTSPPPNHSDVLAPRTSTSLPVPAVRPPAAKRTRRERSLGGRLSSLEFDESDESKRATHNVLERRRREDLKLLYANLRQCLPTLATNERAAKVKILEQAHSFARQLKAAGSNTEKEIAMEERRNIYLHQLLAETRSRLQQSH